MIVLFRDGIGHVVRVPCMSDCRDFSRKQPGLLHGKPTLS